MTSTDRRSFAARMAELGPALEFVETACAARGVARRDALRLAFILEELFTNTVTHGHGGDCAAPVSLALGFEADAVVLDYRDSAPAYNPLDRFHREPAGMDAPLSARQAGGLGVYLVGRLVETGCYRRAGGRNLLRLRLPLEG